MRFLAPDEDPREEDGCDGCGADIYHGEPHYGDCPPRDQEIGGRDA